MQNIAAGNTILLNPAATGLICEATTEVDNIVVHDWWVYLMVTGAGGRVVHDDQPTRLYRQHSNNVIGANDSLRARLQRIGMILRGRLHSWTETNIAALDRSAHRLTPENRVLLRDFAQTRHRRLPGRLKGLSRLGLYRQSRASMLALWAAMALNRL